MLAMLIRCGLRRGELLALTLESIQQWEEHWGIADFAEKVGHVRTVPIPQWVRTAIDDSTAAAAIPGGPIVRAINKPAESGATECHRRCCGMSGRQRRKAGSKSWRARPAPHVRAAVSPGGGELEQVRFLLGHVSIQTPGRYLGCQQKPRCAVMSGSASNQTPQPDWVRRLRMGRLVRPWRLVRTNCGGASSIWIRRGARRRL